MTLAPFWQWLAFVIAAVIAVGGALGMTTTMSMFRSGIFLMASFIGVAALFILLSADLLALLQVMMYVGGMLVMILFMALFMHDPGGAMMAGMKMSRIERFFSRGIAAMKGGGQMDMSQMDMSQMSMTTPIKRRAAGIALLTAVLLLALLLLRPAWPLLAAAVDPNSAARVGHLLMDKYMMAFEGAGLLILIGIFGAVLLARGGRRPDADSREQHVAVAEPPAPLDAAPYRPLNQAVEQVDVDAVDIHRDDSSPAARGGRE